MWNDKSKSAAKGRVAWLGFGRLASAIARYAVAERLVARTDMQGTHHDALVAQRLTQTVGISVGVDNAAAAASAECVVLCARPNQVICIAKEIATSMTSETLLISFAPRVSLRELRAHVPECGAIYRMSPLHRALGASLSRFFFSGETDVCGEANERLRETFGRLGDLILVPEDVQDAYGIFASCSPAFLARIRRIWSALAVEHGVSEQDAVVIGEALGPVGWGVPEDRNQQIENSIATTGGVTEAGLAAMEQSGIREILNATASATLARLDELDRAWRARGDAASR